METIEYLLSVVLKLALALFVAAAVLWLVGLLYPNFKISHILSGNVIGRDWLPAPKNYGSLLGKKTNSGMNGQVYVPGPAYNGYGNTGGYGGYTTGSNVDWVYYTTDGTKVVHGGGTVNDQVFTGDTSSYAEKSLYIRNLSVYEGGSISYGLTFVGEARDTMFRNGTFPITIIDKNKRIITGMDAINTGTWSTPGWVRFQATVPVVLPHGIDCALVFHSTNQSVKVGIAVRCN